MVEIQQLRTFLFKTSKFAQQLICIMSLSRPQNHQKLDVAAAKKNKKRKIFLYF